jgi:hypothetical protein
MTKVYIVTENTWHQNTICAVFLSKDEAITFKENLDKTIEDFDMQEYSVTEWELQ